MLVSAFVTAIIVDALYGFFYTRIYNVEHSRYNNRYWVFLATISLLFPLISVVRVLASRLWLVRRFSKRKFGIAIAPFEVASTEVRILSAAEGLRALDEVMNQFFRATRVLLSDEEWAQEFEFRFLSPTVHVRSTRDATKRRASLDATLLMWGLVVQADRLMVNLRLTGIETDMSIRGSLDPMGTLAAVKVWSLAAASHILEKEGVYIEAASFLETALGFAREIEEHAVARDPQSSITAVLGRSLERVQRKVIALLAAALATVQAQAA